MKKKEKGEHIKQILKQLIVQYPFYRIQLDGLTDILLNTSNFNTTEINIIGKGVFELKRYNSGARYVLKFIVKENGMITHKI